jgi:hypothetical protein
VSRGRSGSADLVVVALLTLIAILLAAASPPGWLQAVGLAPLAIALPGYALVAALFPPGTLAPSDRFVHAFVFCISAAALGGLLLQLAVDLDRTVWIAIMASVSLVGSAAAWRRRQALPIQYEAGLRRPPPGAAWGLAFLLAIAGGAAAIAIAGDGVREQQSRQVFTSLWAVPSTEPGGTGPVVVGVVNHGGPATFDLEVSAAGEVVQRLPVRLGRNREWRRQLPPPVDSNTKSLRIGLVHGSVPYRSVELNIEEEE